MRGLGLPSLWSCALPSLREGATLEPGPKPHLPLGSVLWTLRKLPEPTSSWRQDTENSTGVSDAAGWGPIHRAVRDQDGTTLVLGSLGHQVESVPVKLGTRHQFRRGWSYLWGHCICSSFCWLTKLWRPRMPHQGPSQGLVHSRPGRGWEGMKKWMTKWVYELCGCWPDTPCHCLQHRQTPPGLCHEPPLSSGPWTGRIWSRQVTS